MASKNINIALFLTINLVFFGFTMAQDPGSQAPTCPRSSTQVEACVNGIISFIDSVFPITTQRLCCFNLFDGVDASVASVCICDAVKLADPLFEQNNLFPRVIDVCFISPPAGFRCA